MTKERKTYEIQKHRFIVHTHAYMFSKPLSLQTKNFIQNNNHMFITLTGRGRCMPSDYCKDIF